MACARVCACVCTCVCPCLCARPHVCVHLKPLSPLSWIVAFCSCPGPVSKAVTSRQRPVGLPVSESAFPQLHSGGELVSVSAEHTERHTCRCVLDGRCPCARWIPPTLTSSEQMRTRRTRAGSQPHARVCHSRLSADPGPSRPHSRSPTPHRSPLLMHSRAVLHLRHLGVECHAPLPPLGVSFCPSSPLSLFLNLRVWRFILKL